MTLLQTAVLALVLLSIAAVFWTSAAAFRDAPLLIVVAAALPAAMIAALFPDLRVLSLFVLTTGGVLAYLLSLGPLIDRANTSRVSAQDRDPAELTWLLIVTPLAVGLLNALLAFIPLPDVDAAAQLRSALNLGQLMLLISAAFAVRAAVHPTVVGRFAIRDCDLSHSQQIMRAALAVPPLFLILGACIWMGADLYGQSHNRILPAAYHAALWLAAGTTAPGFPIAWLAATLLHRHDTQEPDLTQRTRPRSSLYSSVGLPRTPPRSNSCPPPRLGLMPFCCSAHPTSVHCLSEVTRMAMSTALLYWADTAVRSIAFLASAAGIAWILITINRHLRRAFDRWIIEPLSADTPQEAPGRPERR
jgi:hypothetical protein